MPAVTKPKHVQFNDNVQVRYIPPTKAEEGGLLETIGAIFSAIMAFFRDLFCGKPNAEIDKTSISNQTFQVMKNLTENKEAEENEGASSIGNTSTDSSPTKANKKWPNEELKKVWGETKTALIEQSYVSKSGKTIKLPRRGYKTWMTKSKGGINQVYLYKNASNAKPVGSKYPDMKVTVQNLDSLDAAASEIAQGRNPVVLNFANRNKKTPGGGFESGANAQEEDLCRRSELGQMMYSQKHNKIPGTSHYPIDDKLIYTPNLTVFREGRAKNYAFMDKPFQVSYLTSAAPDLEHDFIDQNGNPIKSEDLIKVNENGKVDYADPNTKDYVRQLAITQLHAAYQNGHDSVILGAFGCGAFSNPPDAVAQIYKEVLETYYKGAFKSVVFAILNDQHSQGTKPHSPKGNFRAFKDCFEGTATEEAVDHSSVMGKVVKVSLFGLALIAIAAACVYNTNFNMQSFYRVY